MIRYFGIKFCPQTLTWRRFCLDLAAITEISTSGQSDPAKPATAFSLPINTFKTPLNSVRK